MNEAERWSIVSELLSRALDLPESERRSFLTDAMRDRPSLRTEVLRMLEEVGSMEGFVETPPAAPSPDPAGFGPYRLLGELGEGGMGIVYLAERRDGRLTRRVAIKRIGTAAPARICCGGFATKARSSRSSTTRTSRGSSMRVSTTPAFPIW